MDRQEAPAFDDLVHDVSKLYSDKFDRVARRQIGISLAQYRLLATLAMHEGGKPLSQAQLAERMDLSAMGVVGLCQRMEQRGWIQRTGCQLDRRVNEVTLQPPADEALDALLGLGNTQADEALAGLSAEERAALMGLLGKVHARLREMEG